MFSACGTLVSVSNRVPGATCSTSARHVLITAWVWGRCRQVVPDSFHRKPIASSRTADAPLSTYPSSTSVSSSRVLGSRTSTSTWSGPNVVQASVSLPSGRGNGWKSGVVRGRTTCEVSKSGSRST